MISVQLKVSKENEDGSVDYTMDASPEANSYLASVGMKFLLYCAAANLTPETVFNNLIELVVDDAKETSDLAQEEFSFDND